MVPPWGLVNDIIKDVLRVSLVPPWGLIYGCAAAEPPCTLWCSREDCSKVLHLAHIIKKDRFKMAACVRASD